MASLDKQSRKYALVIAVIVLGWCNRSLGDEQMRLLTVAQPVTLSEDPSRATMTVSSGTTIITVVPALIIRSANEQESIVASRFPVSAESESLTITTSVVGQKGGTNSFISTIGKVSQDSVYLRDSIALQHERDERRKKLDELESQRTLQGANLERLQEDADVIANVGRIVDAEDELGAVKSDVDRLSAALIGAQSRLAAFKSVPPPKNFERREGELTTYLNDLSRSLKDTQAAAQQRVVDAQEQMQRNVALIEATKNEHIDLLQKELVALRKEREGLEVGALGHDGRP